MSSASETQKSDEILQLEKLFHELNPNPSNDKIDLLSSPSEELSLAQQQLQIIAREHQNNTQNQHTLHTDSTVTHEHEDTQESDQEKETHTPTMQSQNSHVAAPSQPNQRGHATSGVLPHVHSPELSSAHPNGAQHDQHGGHSHGGRRCPHGHPLSVQHNQHGGHHHQHGGHQHQHGGHQRQHGGHHHQHGGHQHHHGGHHHQHGGHQHHHGGHHRQHSGHYHQHGGHHHQHHQGGHQHHQGGHQHHQGGHHHHHVGHNNHLVEQQFVFVIPGPREQPQNLHGHVHNPLGLHHPHLYDLRTPEGFPDIAHALQYQHIQEHLQPYQNFIQQRQQYYVNHPQPVYVHAHYPMSRAQALELAIWHAQMHMRPSYFTDPLEYQREMALREEQMFGPMAYGRRFHQSPPPHPHPTFRFRPEEIANRIHERRHARQRVRYYREPTFGVQPNGDIQLRPDMPFIGGLGFSGGARNGQENRPTIDNGTQPRRRSPHTLPHVGMEEYVTQPLLWLGLEALEMQKKLMEAQILALASTSSVSCTPDGACGPFGVCQVIGPIGGIGDNDLLMGGVMMPDPPAPVPTPEEVEPSLFVAEFMERRMTMAIYRDGNAPRYGPSNPPASEGGAPAPAPPRDS
ncbi:hypothetical protein KR074_004017 [Drosophila pseudoananassae]|nr:hypothetical protein KR074_004017 [Drosophila pseudoananassae]